MLKPVDSRNGDVHLTHLQLQVVLEGTPVPASHNAHLEQCLECQRELSSMADAELLLNLAVQGRTPETLRCPGDARWGEFSDAADASDDQSGVRRVDVPPGSNGRLGPPPVKPLRALQRVLAYGAAFVILCGPGAATFLDRGASWWPHASSVDDELPGCQWTQPWCASAPS